MKLFALVQLAVLLLAREAASSSPALTAPTTAPTNYSITRRMPEGCEPAADDCTIFVGVNLNEGDNNYLDIYLEAQASGYVAIGFSNNQNMPMLGADVVHCVRNPANDMVEARDSWNANSGRSNAIDTTQDISTFNATFNAGRIECSVAKRIIGTDIAAGQDIDLSTPGGLFMIYARLPTDVGNFPNLQNHGGANRNFSPARVILPSTVVVTMATTMATTQGTTVAPVTQPANLDITARVPEGCEPADCDLFVRVSLNQANDGYVNIYLEGEADGYVAVGFSDTPTMFSADVVHCVRNPADNMVVARDSWNEASRRGNTIDTTQDITTFNATYMNGRIQCSVAKRIIGSDAGQDLNLNTPLWMIYARLPTDVGNFPNLQNHGPANRFVSDARVPFPPNAATTMATTEGAQSLHSLPVVVMVVAALLAVVYY